ncbi:MAG TPA: hypothetical protein VHW46_08510 [Terracidiphilus sp.]|jgi:hypothetical protein|nr:hypothetical protein [Terracidiphilus sp.]
MDYFTLMAPLILAVLVLLILAKLIASKAGKGREASKTTDGQLTFAPNRKSFWGVYLFIGCLTFVTLSALAHGIKSGTDLAVPALCVGFILLLLMVFPATIIANEQGIEQIYWLRGRKHIAWHDVKNVSLNEKYNELRIDSKTGVKIVHTRQLPDRKRLLNELDDHRAEQSVPVVAPPQALAMSDPAA